MRPPAACWDWNADLLSARWSPDGEALLACPIPFCPLDGADSKERAGGARSTRGPLPCSICRTRKISCVLPLIAGLE